MTNSTLEQIQRIARLGLLVSANPYYTTQFADMYAQVDLGPERADQMVPKASALAQGIGLSFHSDLPMGPRYPGMLGIYGRCGPVSDASENPWSGVAPESPKAQCDLPAH